MGEIILSVIGIAIVGLFIYVISIVNEFDDDDLEGYE